MGTYYVLDGETTVLQVTAKDDERKVVESVSKADVDWAVEAANDLMDGQEMTVSQITRFFGRGAQYMTESDWQERAKRRVAKREEEAPVVEEDAEVELSADGAISKTDEERQMIFGWAYVTHDTEGNVNVDKSGDFIDAVEEIEKSAYDFVLNSRAGDFDHTNLKSAEMVESMVFTPEKIEKMGLPAGSVPLGWWIGFHFADKADWEIAKTKKAFSIHGKGTRKAWTEDK
jgi:hypothetical protein